MHVTPEMAEGAYELLRLSPPFRGWKMPPAEEVDFHITATPNDRGDYNSENGRHRIRISYRCARYLPTLLATMAHEMVHLREAQLGVRWDVAHSNTFHRLADQVCKYHGFDRGMF